MTPLKYLLPVFASTLLIACGGGGGDDGAAVSGDGQQLNKATEEGLFKAWELIEGSVSVEGFSDLELDLDLDLSSGDYDTPVDVSYSLPDLAELGSCDCEITLSGDDSAGNYTLNNCIASSASSPFSSTCNSLNQTGTYAHNNAQLTLTTASGNDLVFQ